MFMIPQPDAEPRVEECPVIHVPDSAKDWENVLTVIYMSPKLYRKLEDYHPDIIISMLHLGVKYQIDHIRDTAIQSLKASIPSERQSWAASSDKSNGYEFKLIDAASRIGLQSVLPALYLLCLKHYSLDQILNGVKAHDASLQFLPGNLKTTLILARDKLILKTTELIVECYDITDISWLEEGDCGPGCVAPRISAITSFLRRPIQNVTSVFDKPELFKHDSGCEGCYLGSWWQDRVADKIWNLLPSFFDLPEWEILIASDRGKFPHA